MIIMIFNKCSNISQQKVWDSDLLLIHNTCKGVNGNLVMKSRRFYLNEMTKVDISNYTYQCFLPIDMSHKEGHHRNLTQKPMS